MTEAPPADAAAIAKKFTGLLIATPTYGDVTKEYATSLFNTARVMQAHRLPFDVAFRVDSLLPRSRNELVAAFLDQTGFSHLLFIDSDVEWPAAAIPALLAADKDVVCGVYRKKTADPTDIQWACNWKVEQGVGHNICPATGMIEIHDAATGFLLLSRTMLLRMREAYAGRRYRVRDASEGKGPTSYAHDLFGMELGAWSDGEQVLFSEDYAFCRRWRAIGGQIWAHPGIPLGHRGMWAWRADLNDWLHGRAQPGYQPNPAAIRTPEDAERAQAQWDADPANSGREQQARQAPASTNTTQLAADRASDAA